MTSRRRLLLASLAAVLVLAPLTWLWASSLLPEEYSVMDMGYVDTGGAATVNAAAAQPGAGHAGHAGPAGSHADGRSITELVPPPDRPADVSVRLVARAETFRPGNGASEVDGYTLNGRSPGPVIRARQGDLVEVVLENESVPAGITLHWHGIDVPNAMDGVAGVTQDAVTEGGRFTYRFVADQAGTYWYHSHQLSHEQVKRGLLGAVVISPRHDDAPERVDVPTLVHLYDGVRTVNGHAGDVAADVAAGDTARVRVVNTDNGPMSVWTSGAPYRVLAVDGTDVNRPTSVSGKAVLLTAGGRVDLEVEVPADGARVELGGSNALLLGTGAGDVTESQPPDDFVDLLTYGAPQAVGFDVDDAQRTFEYVVDRRPGFLDGRPGLWWTINGHLYPDVPMFTVDEGDVVRMRIDNESGEVHPMHLHGHHAVVLSRNGKAATGSPWWVDSLNVADGESYEIAFLADNPGVWMDHCHNLPHAAEGLVAHLMYTGWTTPFVIGGEAGNEPE